MEKLTSQKGIQSNKITALSFFSNIHGEVTEYLRDPKCIGSMASTRLQINPSLAALSNIGYEYIAYSFHYYRERELNKLGGSRACFVGKMSVRDTAKARDMAVANWKVINHLKNQKAKIVLTYCDNLLFNTKSKIICSLYKELFQIADYIVYPSEILKSLSQQFAPPTVKAAIIKDPWQVREKFPYPPKENGMPWRIIWFGSNKNLKYLLNLLPQLLNSRLLLETYELTVLASEYATKQVSEVISKTLKTANNALNWKFRFVVWDTLDQPNQLEMELKRAQISIVPSDANDPLKKGASHNRIIDSIRSGCLTIASPLASYQELSKVAVLGNKFETLLYLTTNDYERLIRKHNLYRDEHLRDFSPNANLKSWENFWNSVL